ncbi:MAG TPA: hypothetical protein VHV10_06830 [Ktedonobacteraceae bacterium]|nr:hypothetical protein [Ktedonobacteraceae bacterium]
MKLADGWFVIFRQYVKCCVTQLISMGGQPATMLRPNCVQVKTRRLQAATTRALTITMAARSTTASWLTYSQLQWSSPSHSWLRTQW